MSNLTKKLNEEEAKEYIKNNFPRREAKEEITTTNLAEFGYREIKEAKDLLTAYVENGLPDDFNNEEITIMFNKHSGNVFLTNSEYQVAFASEGKLYSFYSCSECGHEGSEEEGFNNEDKSLCDECYEKENS